MIVVRTPLRISLFGGGSDIPAFYESDYAPGRVLSFTIDKYIHTFVSIPCVEKVIVSYSRKEIVDRSEELENDLVKHALGHFGIETRVEIGATSDIPYHGVGMGGSSAYTVGLCNALSNHQGRQLSSTDLAEEAFYIERHLKGSPVGKQDHYAAAFGGLTEYRFWNSGVDVEKVDLDPKIVSRLESSLVLAYTGLTRSANDILSEMDRGELETKFVLKELASLVGPGRKAVECGDVREIGELLKEAWSLKSRIDSAVAPKPVTDLIDKGRDLGALGWKLLGAGGGGFVLFVVDPQNKLDFSENFETIEFSIVNDRSKVVYQK